MQFYEIFTYFLYDENVTRKERHPHKEIVDDF